MPKLSCPCGFLHDLTPIPDDGWITIRDRDYEELIEEELRSREGAAGVARKIARLQGRLYQCPECARVLWEKPDEQSYVAYRLEDTD